MFFESIDSRSPAKIDLSRRLFLWSKVSDIFGAGFPSGDGDFSFNGSSGWAVQLWDHYDEDFKATLWVRYERLRDTSKN